MNTTAPSAPRVSVRVLLEYWKQDMLSGFLVFLIALPLCLGIAMASGYPPIAGIFTAVVGGILCPCISNSELTIKGPAAGLIVIALGCIQGFGGDNPETVQQAYRLALGVGVAAGILQILFGLCRTGILGEFFPTATVHGLLAAIGIIIASKQVHTLMGVTPTAKEPLGLLAEIPHSIMSMNPEVAVIGLVSLAILFGLPMIKNPYVRRLPAPMLVVIIAVVLGRLFDLEHEHTYLFLNNQEYTLGPRFLVTLPDRISDAVTYPDFSGLSTFHGWEYVILFALIGSLESLLSAKAVDLLDPIQRRTDMNRDLLAIGIANTVAASIGGLPMISEIVRSSANVNNGGRTRFANLYHGLFLLIFVAVFPGLIHQIPLAALAGMLVYTGFRLASPKEWLHVYRIGREQLLIFASTVVAVLATDLLIGIAVGIAVKFMVHWWNGVPVRALFRPSFAVEEHDDCVLVTVRDAAIFSSWIALRNCLTRLPGKKDVHLDLSETRLVDHTVMEKLHELQKDFLLHDRDLLLTGLEHHQKLSAHPFAARKKSSVT